MSHRRQVCCVIHQTCLLCHTAEMSAVSDTTDRSAVSHSRHFFRLKQQTHPLRDTTDMSAVRHSRHVCCVTQQTCLLCRTADMSVVWHGRHVCCLTHQTCQTCPLCHTPDMSDMSAVSHSWPTLKSNYFCSGLREQPRLVRDKVNMIKCILRVFGSNTMNYWMKHFTFLFVAL